MQKDKYYMIPTRVVKFIVRMQGSGDQELGEWGLLFSLYRVSVWDDEMFWKGMVGRVIQHECIQCC